MAAGIAIWRDRAAEVSACIAGSFKVPAAAVLNAGDRAGPFEHAELDVMSTVSVNRALAPADRSILIDRAAATWGA
jgi:hypothetical protein